MNPRSPLTPGGAFARIKDILGAKVCAQFLGVSEWTVYDRCGAQDFSKLNISFAQAFELDGMCKEQCNETPLCNLYNERIDAIRQPSEPTLEMAAIELARDVGEVEGEVLSIRESGCRSISNRKVIDIQNSLAKVKRDVAGMEAIVESAGGAA